MSRALIVSLAISSLLVFVPRATLAQCSAPASAGVRICSPTANATVVFVPAIEINSTPVSGAIHQFIIYDNGKQLYQGSPYQSGIILYDGSVRNGTHNVVVNAWDTTGHMLQAKVTFQVVGQGYPLFCSTPSAPGVNFCVPPANSVQIAYIPASARAKGYSAISTIQLYLDGKFQLSESGNNYLSTSVFPPVPGTHTVTMVASDTTGHRFSASRTVKSTYGYYECAPKGNFCMPGFEINTPGDEAFVGSSFTVNAQIVDNPNPITTIRVYLDGKQVAQSSGPTISQTVSGTPSGTHVLTFQAWDTAGKLYRVQQNLNINVPH
jgi:hypothetical protein